MPVFTTNSNNTENHLPMVEYTYQIASEEPFGNNLVLTGGTYTVQEIRPEDVELDKNLHLARQIIEYAGSVVRRSNTYPMYCSDNDWSLLETCQVIGILRSDFEIQKAKMRREGKPADLYYQYIAKKTHEYSTGNCGEMSIVGGYFPGRGNTPITLLNIAGGGHQFLVVGRRPEGGEQDSRVVADTWARCFYPLDRKDLFLRDCVGLHNGFPIVNPLGNKKLQRTHVFPAGIVISAEPSSLTSSFAVMRAIQSSTTQDDSHSDSDSDVEYVVG